LKKNYWATTVYTNLENFIFQTSGGAIGYTYVWIGHITPTLRLSFWKVKQKVIIQAKLKDNRNLIYANNRVNGSRLQGRCNTVLEEEQTLNSASANNGIWSRLRRSITWWGIMEIVKSVKHLKWADHYLDEDAHPW